MIFFKDFPEISDEIGEHVVLILYYNNFFR